ncbi:MAG: hypothetical protein JJU02_01115 [Cryomorphaceae bacterium]|nr:hypothetical protein [Cryomorphaceae bacterium]
MKNGLVIADAGSTFSLAIFDKLELLEFVTGKKQVPAVVVNSKQEIKA